MAQEAGKRVFLHPLAIVAISDHFTGIEAGGSVKPPGSKVLGLLWGKQQGLDSTITDAVELLYNTDESSGLPLITAQELNKQKELYTKVYPGHEILGWYSVGTGVMDVDTVLHREIMKYNESPYFLLMHPSPDSEAKDLPVAIYESEMHTVDDEMKMIFVDCPFQLETTQAERVTMEEVAKATPTDGVSTLDLHVNGLNGSLRSLSNRTETILKYLQATEQGDIVMDQKLLRAVSSICNQLPTLDKDDLEDAVGDDYNEFLMVNYLASVTKNASQMNELNEKMAKIVPSMSRNLLM
jgi:COP9 signalosome complex subunit 6